MELDELGIEMEAQNCLNQIQQESRISADYEPSHGMTEEELHNFCKFLYSQVQSKDEEVSRLTANIKELTDEVRLSPKKILHTITRVEERHNLDPLEYLCDVFRRIKTTAKDKLADLLAHKWYPATAAVWE